MREFGTQHRRNEKRSNTRTTNKLELQHRSLGVQNIRLTVENSYNKGTSAQHKEKSNNNNNKINVIYVLGNEYSNRSQQHSINGILEEHNAADDSRKAFE